MLGSSILGFHTQFHCNNFLDSVDRYLEARIDREQQRRRASSGTRTLVRPVSDLDRVAEPLGCSRRRRRRSAAQQLFAELGLRADALLGVGVDRLDYTKGIEERLLAVERLLERFPTLRGRFTFVQLAAPSRTDDRALPGSSDRVEAHRRRGSTGASATAATARSCCCARTTSRRTSSASTAPPTSATSAACTTA